MDNFLSLCYLLTIFTQCHLCHLFVLVKMSEEWASLKRKPPPAWCPCVSTDSGQNHLSPHFQRALKKWFTDHFRVDDGVMKVIQHYLVTWLYPWSPFYLSIYWWMYLVTDMTFLLIPGAGHSQANWERKLLRMYISHGWQNAWLCPWESRLVIHIS